MLPTQGSWDEVRDRFAFRTLSISKLDFNDKTRDEINGEKHE